MDEERIRKYIADRLKQARLDSGLSQIEVAELLERPQSFVSRSETGDRQIEVLDLYQFAKILNKPVSYFLPTDNLD